MHFLLFGLCRKDTIPLAKQIFAQNGRTVRDFQQACREDYWALLMDQDDKILAECTVYPQCGLFSTKIQSYYICDVFVHPPYRGNGYGVALILNVMYELGDSSKQVPFYLHAYRRNRSALRCYKKIFGEPYRVGKHLVTFISIRPTSFWEHLKMMQ